MIILCGLPGSGKTTFAKRLDLYYFNPPREDLWRRLMLRNQHSEHGTVRISHTDLERMLEIFQPPDSTEFALFDHAAEVVDPHLYRL